MVVLSIGDAQKQINAYLSLDPPKFYFCCIYIYTTNTGFKWGLRDRLTTRSPKPILIFHWKKGSYDSHSIYFVKISFSLLAPSSSSPKQQWMAGRGFARGWRVKGPQSSEVVTAGPWAEVWDTAQLLHHQVLEISIKKGKNYFTLEWNFLLSQVHDTI